jgi:Flp pilus assembly protein TadG
MRRRGRGDERGVVALTVALLLVMILAVAALAVDGSVLYLKHRDVRTANDAAALAAAWSCGRKEGLATAEAQADSLATQNVFNANQKIPNVYTPDCDADSGTVTTYYQAEQDLLFGPAIGVGSSRMVSATATAKWGGTGGASQVAPLMLSAHRLSDCEIPDGDLTPYQDRCIFWWNNGPDTNSNGTWGLMNLDTWGVDPTYNCQPPGFSSYRTWLESGYPGALYLKPEPDPTYVCADPGFYGQGALNNALNEGIGKEYAFPVNDPQEQLDKDGNLCPPACANVDKYSIIGFAWLLIEGVYSPTDAGWDTYCAGVVPLDQVDGSTRCLVALWVGFERTPIISSGDGENFGIIQTWLVG